MKRIVDSYCVVTKFVKTCDEFIVFKGLSVMKFRYVVINTNCLNIKKRFIKTFEQKLVLVVKATTHF